MLCKAIIESKLSKYKFKVRIPSIHKGVESIGATPEESVPKAIVTVNPGIYPALKVNDVVLVGFEDDNIDKPVIVGVLYNESCYNIESDIEASSLKVKVNSTLPEDTKIGDVTSNNIKHLKGLNRNAQTQFNELNDEIVRIYEEGCGELVLLLSQINSQLETFIGDWK